MKLTINLMIKDGRKIISRDTKGYKVLLNRIVKEFAKIKNPADSTIDLIIQTSKAGARNKSKRYSKTCGIARISKRNIEIWVENCTVDKQVSQDRVLEVIAHEFGHFYDFFNLGVEFWAKGTYAQEDFADKFAKKMVKRELISKSYTGLTKFARVQPPMKIKKG